MPGTIMIDGTAVHRYRTDGFLSQRELADRAGVRVSTVSAIERGARPQVYRGTLRRIADALNVAPQALLAAHEGETPPEDHNDARFE